jgi:hypothetical protein
MTGQPLAIVAATLRHAQEEARDRGLNPDYRGNPHRTGWFYVSGLASVAARTPGPYAIRHVEDHRLSADQRRALDHMRTHRWGEPTTMTTTNAEQADPAAIAASTAMGWSYALNTVARPAPEHLEAAQAALSALQRADQAGAWADTVRALAEALDAARARLKPTGVTIADLVAAVEQLRAIGLVAGDPLTGPGSPAGRRDARIAELETELAEAERAAVEWTDRADVATADLQRQTELCDRFESEVRELRGQLRRAEQDRAAERHGLSESLGRELYRWLLAELGMNAPGYDQQSADELKATAAGALKTTVAEAGQMHVVNQRLRQATRRLGDASGDVYQLPEATIGLAELVVAQASRTATQLGGLRQTSADHLEEIRELRTELNDLKRDDGGVRLEQLNAQARRIDELKAERDALLRDQAPPTDSADVEPEVPMPAATPTLQEEIQQRASWPVGTHGDPDSRQY